ncbi:MAG: hypothetical protein AB8B85_15470 [Paracoccaceae bacterium]
MRMLLLGMFVVLAACRAPYMSEYADLTVRPFEIPPYGTPKVELAAWFDENYFAPGPRVFQAEAELRRLPGAPLAYALDEDRSWWLSRAETVRDLCVTQKYVYYKLDAEDRLARAILTSRSQC